VGKGADRTLAHAGEQVWITSVLGGRHPLDGLPSAYAESAEFRRIILCKIYSRSIDLYQKYFALTMQKNLPYVATSAISARQRPVGAPERHASRRSLLTSSTAFARAKFASAVIGRLRERACQDVRCCD
jgi:hypothetical protein